MKPTTQSNAFISAGLLGILLSVPRKNPMPSREVEISRRLREVRARTRLTQIAFARELGIDTSTLGSIEHARAPLRYWIAARAAERFDISQKWLATGHKPRNHFVNLDPSLEATVNPQDLFSKVYDSIAPFITHRLAEFARSIKRKPEDLDALANVPAGAPQEEDDVISYITRALSLHFRTMPLSLQRAYYKALLARSDDFLKRYGPQIRAFHEERRKQLLAAPRKIKD